MLELPNNNRMEFIALLCEREGERGSRERRGSDRGDCQAVPNPLPNFPSLMVTHPMETDCY